MTDKAKERITRNCSHTIMLRAKDLASGEYVDIWECADCQWQMELAPVLEESAT